MSNPSRLNTTSPRSAPSARAAPLPYSPAAAPARAAQGTPPAVVPLRCTIDRVHTNVEGVHVHITLARTSVPVIAPVVAPVVAAMIAPVVALVAAPRVVRATPPALSASTAAVPPDRAMLDMMGLAAARGIAYFWEEKIWMAALLLVGASVEPRQVRMQRYQDFSRTLVLSFVKVWTARETRRMSTASGELSPRAVKWISCKRQHMLDTLTGSMATVALCQEGWYNA